MAMMPGSRENVRRVALGAQGVAVDFQTNGVGIMTIGADNAGSGADRRAVQGLPGSQLAHDGARGNPRKRKATNGSMTGGRNSSWSSFISTTT